VVLSTQSWAWGIVGEVVGSRVELATRSYFALHVDYSSLEGRCGFLDDGGGGVVVEELWDILSVGSHLYAPRARATFRLVTAAGDESA
jgi:hypothetical protein